MPAPFAENCESLLLFEDTPALMMHPRHPLAQSVCISPKELSGKTLIWPRINHGLKETVESGFAAKNLPPPLFSSHNQTTAWTLAKKGAGAVLVPSHSKGSYTRGLVIRPIDLPACRRAYRLYLRKSRVLTPEDLLFLDFVKSYRFAK